MIYLEKIARATLDRDQIMAENTARWQRHTGHRMLLSAHNGHVSYESKPQQYPKTQQVHTPDGRGPDAIGYTFGQGSFNAMDLTIWRPTVRSPVEPRAARVRRRQRVALVLLRRSAGRTRALRETG